MLMGPAVIAALEGHPCALLRCCLIFILQNPDAGIIIYEVAVFFGNDFVPLQEHDDVIGWQTPEEITTLMKEAQENTEFVLIVSFSGSSVC